MYLLRQVCHSLAEAHARGMVHRDIKPANIFLCRMGLEFDFVKVLDFGLVQTRKADPPTAVTETLITAQQLIGTPAYMAPEMILGKDDVDRRADVYAIGCVAFYLLTGTRVFQDGNADAGADRSRAHRAGAALGAPRPAVDEGARSSSSSIAFARSRTTGRATRRSCWSGSRRPVSRAPGPNTHARSVVAGAPAAIRRAARRASPRNKAPRHGHLSVYRCLAGQSGNSGV